VILLGWFLATASAVQPDEPVIVPRRLQAAMAQEDAAPVPPSADQAQLDRLLGDQSPSPRATATSLPGAGLWWCLPLVALLAGANLWLRRRGGPAALGSRNSPLTIVARQGLGGTSQLVLVEVEDPDGTTRRLLIGTGAEGPRLVSELHPSVDFDRLVAEAPAGDTDEPPAVQAAAQASDRLARRVPPPPRAETPMPDARPALSPPPPSEPATYASRRYRQINRISTSRQSGRAPTPLADRRTDARSLIDEVLAARKEPGWTA